MMVCPPRIYFPRLFWFFVILMIIYGKIFITVYWFIVFLLLYCFNCIYYNVINQFQIALFWLNNKYIFFILLFLNISNCIFYILYMTFSIYSKILIFKYSPNYLLLHFSFLNYLIKNELYLELSILNIYFCFFNKL